MRHAKPMTLVEWKLYLLASLITASFTVSSVAQSGTPDWGKLLDQGKREEARRLCESWTGSRNLSKRIEAEKCLANVALCGAGIMGLQGDDAGGGSLGESYKPEAIDEALAHLEKGLKLAPQDITIHQGRLHLLEVSFRYEKMAEALDETCRIYKGPEGVDPWLAYTYELSEARQYHAALELLAVLQKYYPNSHDVLGNIGAMYSLLKEDEKALPYLKRAVELSPEDPIDTWNLGRLYAYTDKIDLADQWYKKSLALDPDPERKRDKFCMYAEFVDKNLHDPKRACELQKSNCAPDKQSACQSDQQPPPQNAGPGK
jgi:tetratricopeptide (TPR) repeat protein